MADNEMPYLRSTTYEPSQSRNRKGLTLIEMVLVLVLMVVVFSLVVPRLTGSVSSRRLAYAADEVRSAWAKGRNLAMRSGETFQFLYLPESRVFTVVAAPTTLETDGVYEQALSGLSLASTAADETEFQANTLQLAQEGIAMERLPDEISFLDSSTAASLTPMASMQEPTDVFSVSFYPDGSTSNATVWLTNEDGEAIPVLLRGMTGVSVVGKPVSGIRSDRGDD